jgi:Ca-activated chloride channel family protein
MNIAARLTFDRVRFDQDTRTHLVLTLKAPALDWQEKRPRICVVPVVDISGSMSGDKLNYAKQSVLKLIDHLKDDDYAGIVAFGSYAKMIGTPGKLSGDKRASLKKAITTLGTEGSTNFVDGMLMALRAINEMDLPEDVVHRIIMFTDGQANCGPATRIEDVVKLLQANMGRVTASAFGYGLDASQDFLSEFSRTGKGNYAFVKDPDAALTAFGKELGSLISTYGTDLVIEVEPQAGNTIKSVVSDVKSEEDAVGHVTINLPEILAEEERHIVLDVGLSKQKNPGPRSVNAFGVRVHYNLIDKDHKRTRETLEVKGKVQFVKEGEEQKDPEKSLDAIVSVAQVVRAQIEAEAKAKSGDFQAAQDIMLAAVNSTAQRGHTGSSNLAANVSRRLTSQEVYAASEGYLRGVSSGGTRGLGVASYDASALEDLLGANVSVTNSVQTAMSTSFAQGSTAVPQATPMYVPPPLLGGQQSFTIDPSVAPVVGSSPIDLSQMGFSMTEGSVILGGGAALSGSSISLDPSPPSTPVVPEKPAAKAPRKAKQPKSKSW